MWNVSQFEWILDHPPAETDRAFRDDQHGVLVQILHVILHLGSEQMRADAQAAIDSKRVITHTDLLVFKSSVHYTDQITIHLTHQTIFALHAIAIPGK